MQDIQYNTHLREYGVIITNTADSICKHERNIILAICSIATLITCGAATGFLVHQCKKERAIRQVGLPYAISREIVENYKEFKEVKKEEKINKNPMNVRVELIATWVALAFFATIFVLVALALILPLVLL